MKLGKILVPTDFSSDSDQALRWGTSLAENYGAQLLLLHVLPPAVEGVSMHGSEGEQLMMDLEAKVEGQLQELVLEELQKGFPVDLKVGLGKPAEEILRVAREESVDLIVMGTHGHSELRHLLLGSTAESVFHHAPCPVFMVRAAAEGTP
jgi:nucleotide-binding universal stress UspA family protein